MQSGRKSPNATMTGTSPQAVPADTLVEGGHSIAVAVVAANIATAAKAEIIRRFPPSNAPSTSTLRASDKSVAIELETYLVHILLSPA